MKKGFTLIELVMAVVVAGIAVYTLISLFINAATKNAVVEDLSMAVFLAEGKMEEVCSRSFDHISSEAAASFGGTFSDYTSRVVVQNVSSTELNTSVGATTTGYRKITIYVASGSLTSSIEISGLVTNVSN